MCGTVFYAGTVLPSSVWYGFIDGTSAVIRLSCQRFTSFFPAPAKTMKDETVASCVVAWFSGSVYRYNAPTTVYTKKV